jgi:DNA-binding XRE family transcriptional regulator
LADEEVVDMPKRFLSKRTLEKHHADLCASLKSCSPMDRIALNVHKLRLKKKLTQCELAEKAGISPRTFQRIENLSDPKRNTSIDVLTKLAEVLEVDIVEIVKSASFLERE